MGGNFNSGRRPAHEELKLKRGQISSRQLSEMTGVSMSMIDQWTNAGFITPVYVDGEGKGARRVFKKSTIYEISKIAQAMQACPYEHKIK